MADKVDNGGQAFPRAAPGNDGMSLRDYFAATALRGLLADHKIKDTPGAIAHACFALADAMLAARKAKP